MNQANKQAINARSSVYRLVASLFARELTEKTIVGLQQGNGTRLLNALEQTQECAPVIRHLKNQFSGFTNPEQAVLDLAESYAWNFHGVGGSGSAPPYASVYLGESNATHQEIEREIHKIIHDQGLTTINAASEPFDHLSVILEFVAWLDEAEEDARQGNSTEQFRKVIIEKFLLSWLPAFVARCNQSDRLGFYSGLAVATLAFVEADYALAG